MKLEANRDKKSGIHRINKRHEIIKQRKAEVEKLTNGYKSIWDLVKMNFGAWCITCMNQVFDVYQKCLVLSVKKGLVRGRKIILETERHCKLSNGVWFNIAL